MRIKYLTYDVADVDTDGLADGLTGAGPWDSTDFVTTATPDSIAHQLNLTSAANLSAITITLTGTDADGRVVTEDVTGPNANTVESTKYFKTLTAVAASATLGANTLDIGWVDEISSQTIPLDYYANNPATIQVKVTGTIDFDIQTTNSNIRDDSLQDTWSWLTDANFDGKTATLVDQLASPGLRAMRVLVNSYSTGAELEVMISQSR